MRRFGTVLAMTLLAGVTFLASPAAAAPRDAADLADDCNADGRLDISGTMRFRRGAGTLTTDCVVTMAAGSRLVLKDLTLTSTDSFFVIGQAANDTEVRVIRSTIDLGDALQLAPGCCSGEETIPEDNADIVVRDSFLRATSVEVSASTASFDGRVRVRRSTLIATVTSTAVRGSETADVVVSDTDLSAVTSLFIQSGIDGRTRVVRSTLAGGEIDISTGPGGTCRSARNTPNVPCAATTAPAPVPEP